MVMTHAYRFGLAVRAAVLALQSAAERLLDKAEELVLKNEDGVDYRQALRYPRGDCYLSRKSSRVVARVVAAGGWNQSGPDTSESDAANFSAGHLIPHGFGPCKEPG